MADSLNDITQTLRRFAEARDWQIFHSPKNLAMALMVEAGELAEHFQWLTREQSYQPGDREEIKRELADVLIYLVRLADRLDVDLLVAAQEKIRENEEKYPVELARGRADKYTKLQSSS